MDHLFREINAILDIVSSLPPEYQLDPLFEHCERLAVRIQLMQTQHRSRPKLMRLEDLSVNEGDEAHACHLQ